ncbi:MAG: universal stress protein [Bacteroidia bacterium]|nr:universal stress protein [Bacteroidia bacterium]
MNILVPVDFQKTSFAAYEYANNLAHELKAKITLMHVIDARLVYYESIGFEHLNSIKQTTYDRLQRFVNDVPREKDVRLKDVPLAYDVHFGVPGFTIASYIEDKDFDLIVIGVRDNLTLFNRMLGMTSTLVMNTVDIPMILIHENTRYVKPEKVVFAFDDEGELEDAVDTFKYLNNQLKATTQFVHVQQSDKESVTEQVDDIVEELMELKEPEFAFEIKTIRGKDVVKEIVDYCVFSKTDMLAMVHKKDNLLDRILNRSYSIQVANSLHLPILVLPEDDDD